MSISQRMRSLRKGEGGGEIGGIAKYQQYIAFKVLFLIGCAIALFFIAVYSIMVGAAQIPFNDVINAIIGKDSGLYGNIIWNIRVPRVIMGMVAGASLATAGAVMQSILRNPLASPFTLGLSQSAAFGASFAIVVLNAGAMQTSATGSVMVSNPYLVTTFAFLGCMMGMVIILVLTILTRVTPEAMVLAGVAMGSMFSAGQTAMQYFANEVQLASLTYWTFGDLSRSNWTNIPVIVGVFVPVMLFFMLSRWHYNAIDAGEDTAKSLGVNVSRVRIAGMVCASLLSAVVVSFMGIIGFIGLLAPHIVRRIIGGDNRFLIPGSALVGAMLLSGTDTIARTIVAPLVLPVGVITSLMGGPLFLYLLVKGYRR